MDSMGVTSASTGAESIGGGGTGGSTPSGPVKIRLRATDVEEEPDASGPVGGSGGGGGRKLWSIGLVDSTPLAPSDPSSVSEACSVGSESDAGLVRSVAMGNLAEQSNGSEPPSSVEAMPAQTPPPRFDWLIATEPVSPVLNDPHLAAQVGRVTPLTTEHLFRLCRRQQLEPIAGRSLDQSRSYRRSLRSREEDRVV